MRPIDLLEQESRDPAGWAVLSTDVLHDVVAEYRRMERALADAAAQRPVE